MDSGRLKIRRDEIEKEKKNKNPASINFRLTLTPYFPSFEKIAGTFGFFQ